MAVLNWISVAMWYSYWPLLTPESPSVFFPMPSEYFFCPDCHSFPTHIKILTQSFLLWWQGSGSYWCKAQLFPPIEICQSMLTADITVYYLNLVLVTHPCFSLASLYGKAVQTYCKAVLFLCSLKSSAGCRLMAKWHGFLSVHIKGQTVPGHCVGRQGLGWLTESLPCHNVLRPFGFVQNKVCSCSLKSEDSVVLRGLHWSQIHLVRSLAEVRRHVDRVFGLCSASMLATCSKGAVGFFQNLSCMLMDLRILSSLRLRN